MLDFFAAAYKFLSMAYLAFFMESAVFCHQKEIQKDLDNEKLLGNKRTEGLLTF